jgi:hypothetical protein
MCTIPSATRCIFRGSRRERGRVEDQHGSRPQDIRIVLAIDIQANASCISLLQRGFDVDFIDAQ